MIRQARLADEQEVLPLIMVILKDMELDFLQKYGEDKVLTVLAKGYQKPQFRYSYKRALVMEEAGEVVGVAYGYREDEEAQIDEPLVEIFKDLAIPSNEKMFTEKEAFPNEWYLDSIAVRGDQRGKGIGGQLLAALPEFALAQGAHLLGLNVDKGNPRAKKLYEKDGYHDTGEIMINGHLYDHMQKELDA